MTQEQIAKWAVEQLTTLATKLGTTVEQMYSVMIMQAKVEAITSIIWLSFLLLVSLIFFFISYKNFEKDDEFSFGCFAAGAVAMIFFTTVFALDIKTIVTGFVNPEYYVIQQLLRLVGK